MSADTQHPQPRHLWRPYEQMHTAPAPLKVIKTHGSRLVLEDGRELIDGVASWWTACHGYNHPHILQAMQAQMDVMPHVMFGGLVHEPALQLADKLTAMTPSGLNRIFYADSGSVAVEVALKIALQYWQNKGKPGKNKFVCFRNGYHGDTIGAMSVSNPEDSMHKAFRNIVPKHYFLEIPKEEYGFAEFQEMMEGISKTVAGVIIEPLAQCAEGMHFHSADVLAAIHRTAKEHDMLFIADEIATGFYRTGLPFACNEAGISPDIMCLGKALTGGHVPLAATLASDEVFDAFLSDEADKALMHGPTYMGNPLACAAAIASLELFEQSDAIGEAEEIEAHFQAALRPCQTWPGVRDVRIKGAIGVVELEPEHMDRHWFNARFVEEGVWIRPIENVIYLMPPLNIAPDDLASLTGAMVRVIKEWSDSHH